MPELPEVETIRMGLQKYLVGHTVTDIDVRLPKMLTGEVQSLIGAKVQGIRRFGKGLVIDFDNGYSLAIHIKMTGQLVYKGTKVPKETQVSEKVGKILPHNHTHLIFHLNNATLYYNDIRQFGWLKILKTADVKELPFFKDLGPEVFKELTLSLFSDIVKRNKIAIKPLLLEQKKLSGVGNIYANDALFKAGIDPRRKAHALTDTEIEKLFASIEEVMKKGIEVGGSSEWSYVNALGEEGEYQKIFQIYGREGKPCLVCGTVIEKLVLGGRGTYLCPTCQK